MPTPSIKVTVEIRNEKHVKPEDIDWVKAQIYRVQEDKPCLIACLKQQPSNPRVYEVAVDLKEHGTFVVEVLVQRKAIGSSEAHSYPISRAYPMTFNIP
jgi:hypothetical protein